MTDLERLILLAEVVRRALEREYGEKLSCRCYAVSTELFFVAKANGINSIKIAGNYGHVFCIIDDVVIDLTARQFGHNDNIAIGKVGKWPIDDGKYWDVTWSSYSLEEAKMRGGWTLDCDRCRTKPLVEAEFEKLRTKVSL